MRDTTLDQSPVRARIPADLDTPDRLVAGLNARQLLILIAAAVPLWALWQVLGEAVPLPVLAGLTTPIAALALVLALGRRDGLPLDAWLMAAIGHRLRPRRLAPATETTPAPLPHWAPLPGRAPRMREPALLRLPADAIGRDGVISTGAGTAVALVAAGTVSTGLHTPAEQAVLLGGYARWLNSLTGPVQVVVSARRVDLGTRALHVAETAHQLGHRALAAAAIEHAEHLLDLAEDGEPLTRTITIACAATGTPARTSGRSRRSRERTLATDATGAGGGEALRRAARTAAALSALGSRCRVLNGSEVTALLSAAVDPWGPGGPDWPRTPPGASISTGPTPVRADRSVADHLDSSWSAAAPGWAAQASGNEPGTGPGPDPAPQRWSR